MLTGFKIVAILSLIYNLISEAFEYRKPEGYVTDQRLIDADYKAGVPFEVIQKKRRKGAYHVKELVIEPFDLMKYRNDAMAGVDPDELKRRRLAGVYGAEKPITNTYPGTYDNCKPYEVMKENKCNVIVDVERYEVFRKNPVKQHYFSSTLVPNDFVVRMKIHDFERVE